MDLQKEHYEMEDNYTYNVGNHVYVITEALSSISQPEE